MWELCGLVWSFRHVRSFNTPDYTAPSTKQLLPHLQLVIELILATDMKQHFALCAQFANAHRWVSLSQTLFIFLGQQPPNHTFAVRGGAVGAMAPPYLAFIIPPYYYF